MEERTTLLSEVKRKAEREFMEMVKEESKTNSKKESRRRSGRRSGGRSGRRSGNSCSRSQVGRNSRHDGPASGDGKIIAGSTLKNGQRAANGIEGRLPLEERMEANLEMDLLGTCAVSPSVTGGKEDDAQWSGKTQNRDVSTGLLAGPFCHSLAWLTRSCAHSLSFS